MRYKPDEYLGALDGLFSEVKEMIIGAAGHHVSPYDAADRALHDVERCETYVLALLEEKEVA